MTRSLLVLVALASVAHAEKIALNDEPRVKASWNRLGTRVMHGTIYVDGRPMTSMAIGVSIDRPLIGTWRALGEYEYLWLGPRDWERHAMVGVASLPHGGHRVHAGMRRRLVQRDWARGYFNLWIDAEAGGGVALVDHRPTGVIAAPHAFAGARVGMGLVWGKQLWEYEVVVRGLALPAGQGVVLGIGLVWGE